MDSIADSDGSALGESSAVPETPPHPYSAGATSAAGAKRKQTATTLRTANLLMLDLPENGSVPREASTSRHVRCTAYQYVRGHSSDCTFRTFEEANGREVPREMS